MDIPALSTAMATSQLQNQWSIGMMAKAMDTAEQTSQALTKIMESSVTPNLGQNFDARV